MKALGIVHEHNATVCLMEDGRVTFCQSEERLNRIKASAGFPHETLRHVYENVAAPGSIDVAVVFEKTIDGYLSMKGRDFAPAPGSQYLDPAQLAPTFRRRVRMTPLGQMLVRLKAARREGDVRLRAEAEAWFCGALRLPAEKVRYLDHHLAHAYSVVPNIAAWGKTLVLTLDGYGDGLCATVNVFDGGKLQRLSAADDRHSIGTYYCDTTLLLGMKALEDEFKLMGLAPYARRADYEDLVTRLRRMLSIDAQGRWKSAPNPERLMGELEGLYRHRRFDQVAAAIQALTEELIVEWVRHWIDRTGCRSVALAGGVFLNVKASQRVAQMAEVERLFVMPSAGDESCAIGAAAWGTLALQPQAALEPLRDLYLGVGFSAAQIEDALRESDASSRYAISRPADIHRHAAELLAKNRIVARFAGRMEFGARALGNRSILANPSDPRNAARINDAVKERDFWMPFAPSILEEDMARYVCDPERAFAPYMCLAFDATALARHDLAAAIHPRDFTLRPQAVRRQWNPGFHELIRCFKSITGVGALLNTSFNLHGEPIVCSPRDAIRTTDQCGIDYLVLGDFLLAKRPNLAVVSDENHDRSRARARA
jgi:carbamoyltransferase